MDLLVVAGIVILFLELLNWKWESRLQKNVVRGILFISVYLFWKSVID